MIDWFVAALSSVGHARKLRVEYPGAVYHVMNRGNRRDPIVEDRADRLQFLETLREACVGAVGRCIRIV